LENDNEQMENRLKELKIAMGQEKAQREYGPYLFTYKSEYIKEQYYGQFSELMLDSTKITTFSSAVRRFVLKKFCIDNYDY